jgi:alkaline phosphatase/streptomycin-6-phosphatase
MRIGKRGLAAAALGLVGAFAATVAFAAQPSGDRSDDIKGAIDGGKAKHVIFFLGDGMGDSEITIARNYAMGAGGRFAGIDAPMFTGEATTWAVQEGNPTQPDYVTDSAASGTAWATGSKTSNNRVSTTAGTDQDLKTVLEYAQDRGWGTGDVSTAEITDATPAVLASHVRLRGCQGPLDMATCPQDRKSAGGPGSIAEQLIDHGVDVILGGGKARFDQVIPAGEPGAGTTLLAKAPTRGYQVVSDRTGMLAAPTNEKILGLFTAGNMTTEWNGELAKPYPGTGPQRCNETSRPANEPSLSEMTTKAIDLLEASPKASKGWFLQVEGASIDKQDHAENPCAQIGETVAFDKAIQVGLEYAKTHPDTLIVVTADHAHTSQIIDPQTASDHSPGAISVLTTDEGSSMTVNYATNLDGRSQSHTGSEVRVAAQGPQAANVLGVIDQTDLFHLMLRAMGVEGTPEPGPNMAGQNLSGAQLQNADLANATLTGANLSGAQLQGADLSGANLSGANLNGANLTGAKLTGATTSGSNLNGVVWSNTTCPDGANSNAHAGTCVHNL